MPSFRTSLAATAISLAIAGSAISAPKTMLVYIGTYTNATSKGIYAYRFNPASGDLSPLGLQAETPSPSFLAVDAAHKFLYAVNEIGDYQGKSAGSVSAFTMNPKSGKLGYLNTVSTKGDGPCHLAIDKKRKTLVVANYGGGSVAAYPIAADGKLGEAKFFDQHTGGKPHGHSTTFSPDNRFLFSADLGLDEIFSYKVGTKPGSLQANAPPFVGVAKGAGPRHFNFAPNGRFGYAINELGSTVTAFQYDAKAGSLQEIQTISTLPADFKGTNSTAEVFVHPNGRFLYGSNRGHDSIVVFAIDAQGKLSLVQHVSTQGQVPRSFALDPTGKYLFAANQKTDNIVVFQVDGASGKLTPTGKTLQLSSPVCVLFVEAK